MKPDRSIGIWNMTVIAVALGLLTIKSGGTVLFVDGIAREEAGNYVPFVLWFKLLAGFAYQIAAAGLFMQKNGAVWVSIFIAVSTVVVFAPLGLHILNDGLYEVRTVVATRLRTAVWTLIAIFAYRKIIRH